MEELETSSLTAQDRQKIEETFKWAKNFRQQNTLKSNIEFKLIMGAIIVIVLVVIIWTLFISPETVTTPANYIDVETGDVIPIEKVLNGEYQIEEDI